MPSIQHEIFVELFRSRPALARELLLACAGIEIGGSTAELAPTDLSQLAPAQFLVDCVTVFRDGDTHQAAVIVEVQLSPAPDKRFTWPVYVATLRAKLRCPVFLLVLALDPAVARWARQPIALGHPDFALSPIAICVGDAPRIADPAAAVAAPELAILSLFGHPEDDVITAALAAIRSLPEDHKTLYLDVVFRMLPDSARGLVEAQMLNFKYEYQSDFARKYFSEGKQEGLQLAVLSLAREKLGELAPQDEASIRAVHDIGVLTDLVAALGRAPDAAAARALLDQLPRS